MTAVLGESVEAVIEKIATTGTNRVRLAVSDLDGILRGKVVHLDKFRSICSSGFGFCNVLFGWDMNDHCYPNTTYTGWHTGYPDASAKVDLGSYRQVPWEGNLPFFLADLYEEGGQPLNIAPRNLLKKMKAHANEMGYQPFSAQEFEWFNFQDTSEELHAKEFRNPKPISSGMCGYSILRSSQKSAYFDDLFNQLGAFGIPLEGLHTETGPGVYEAAIAYDDVVESADRAILFKTGVKEIAFRHGITPSFMAKWNSKLPGCSGHLHQSLWKDGVNIFSCDDGLNPMMGQYIAGILHCLPYMMPLFAPTVNSYKRFVEGFWAPTTATWGIDNRTVCVRVLPSKGSAARIELRVPGSDANPYLVAAASLAAGLYGIENKLPLVAAAQLGDAGARSENVRLPTTLHQATDMMDSSALMRELLGEQFVDHFIRTRRWEWSCYNSAVTDWELKRYFEGI